MVVEGEPRNLKLTRVDDLELAQALDRRRAHVRNRVGLGFDVHPFGAAPPLVLGGVTHRGRAAARRATPTATRSRTRSPTRSSGPAGLPDLGTLFPATDEQYRGADSMALLADVARRVAQQGWWVENVDVAIAAETPRLAPHVEAMAANLVAALAPLREPMGHGIARRRSGPSAAKASARSGVPKASRSGPSPCSSRS